MVKIVYVERRPGPFASIEKAFREIGKNLPGRFSFEFQQMPFGWRVYEAVRNVLFFKPKPADIYHITGHIHYITLRLPPDRTILSIMDVRFVVLNRGLRRAILKKFYLELPVRRMRYVTTISQKVKDEIIELTKCRPEKIRVLPMPLLSHLQAGPVKPFNTHRPRILQVGTMKNKNVERLAEALRGLDCTLAVVGRLSKEQKKALRENSIDFENHVEVSDERMVELYREADLVTFCSTYEGFGLPIIEAQSMQKPLVTSNISPLKDVAGEGACLIDPNSVSNMRKGLISVISSEEYRAELVDAGTRNVARFSAKTVSEQYAALYGEVLETIE